MTKSLVAAAAGSDYFVISFQNVSDRACQLSGTPKVERIDDDGKVLKSSLEWPVNVNTAGAGRASISLSPDATAKFVIDTANRGGYPHGYHCASKLRITFRNSTALRKPLVINGDSCSPKLSASGFVPAGQD